MNQSWKFFVQTAAIILLTVTVYIPALQCGYIWDDGTYLTTNVLLHSGDGLQRIWFQRGATPQYYPLVHTSFWLEYHLWELNPVGYHLVNVLLHALNAVLVWLLLQALGVKGSWIIAAIFAVHPVHVESVAWVTERKNMLSGLFYLSSLFAYVRFNPAAFSANFNTSANQRKFYWLALVLYACALLSKSVTCTLPVVIMLLIWWKRGGLWWRDMTPLLPFLMLGVAMGLNTVLMEKHRVGAVGSEYALSLIQRCLIASRVLWFYAQKLVWPQKLTFIYPRWQIEVAKLWQWSFVLATITVFAMLWILRKKLGRGLLLAVMFFAVTLGPALGFVNVYPFRYSFVADHFQYLASVGIIALVVAIVRCVLQQNYARLSVSGLVLGILGLLTWRHCAPFHDEETLWRDTIFKNPTCWMAFDNLGHVLQRRGQIPDAIAQYKQALAIKPRDELAHNNWGNALLDAGDVQGAIEHFQQALRIKPDFVEAENNWGNALIRAGNIPEAITHYEQAVRIRPGFAEAQYNIGKALQQAGKLDDATHWYHRALQCDPSFAEAHNNLGEVQRQRGKLQEAIAHFEQALRTKPEFAEPHYNLGLVYTQTGKLTEAIAHYEEALKINPRYAAAHNNLGNTLLQQGRISDAITQFEEALQLNPDYVAAHNNLGNALLRAGRIEDAIRQYEQVLRIGPGSAVGHYNLANVLLQAGSTNDATAHYREALRLDPNLSQAHEMLARSSGNR